MSLWGAAPFGASGTASGSVGVPLSSLIMPAYRIAGIIRAPMVTPSPDMYSECVPELNRLIGTANNDRLKIFTIRIDTLPLTTALKYTVGPGADFDMPRPMGIQNGVVVLSGGVRVQPPMYQMDDEEWARIALQTIPSSIPLAFYYDGSYDTETGYGLIYLWPQASAALQVDWYTWQAIPTFATKDDQVALPPGYEDWIVYGLATRLILLNPQESALDISQREAVRREYRRITAALERHNAPDARTTTDYPSGNPGSGHFDWRTGAIVR